MTGERYIAGQRELKLNHQGYLNASAGRSHPVLNADAVNGVVSVLVGENADPQDGNIAFSLLVQQQSYENNGEAGNVIPFTANFANRGDNGGWGQLIQAPITITNTRTGDPVDGGAATSNGGLVCLHVLLAAATDTYSFVVEHADTSGGTYSTLATFSDLDGSALGSEVVSFSGEVKRYVRVKATRTGSAGNSLTYAVTLLRL